MHWFRNLGVSAKLLLIVVPLALCAIALAGQQLWTGYRNSSTAAEAAQVADLSRQTNDLVHELQKERGLTAAYLSAPDDRTLERLQEEREQVDAARAALEGEVAALPEGAFKARVEAGMGSVRQLLRELDRQRRAVTAGEVPAPEAVRYYSQLNADLLATTGKLSAGLELADTLRALLAAEVLATVKERAGQERALVAQAVANGSVSEAARLRLQALVAQQEQLSAVAAALFSGLQTTGAAGGVPEPTTAIIRARDSIMHQAQLPELSESAWWRTATDRVAQLRTAEKDLSARIAAEAEATIDQAQSRLITSVAVLCLAVVLGLLAWRVSTQIGRRLARLRLLMRRIRKELDFTVRSDEQAEDDVGEMAGALNDMLGEFNRVVGDVKRSAIDLASPAEELAAISQQTNGAITTQQGQVEQVATAMNEMASTVQEISRLAQDASNAAQEADEDADQARGTVGRMVAAMETLEQHVQRTTEQVLRLQADSREIGGIVEIIEGITEQTNLLALNASIEAARAGGHGRGFAVVADEVRTLAVRTKHSTQEIRQMIDRLQGGATDATSAMEQSLETCRSTGELTDRTSERLVAVAESIGRIKDMNMQVASATEEQTAASEEINRNVISIRDSAAENAQASQETARAGEELARLAGDLEAGVAEFKVAARAA